MYALFTVQHNKCHDWVHTSVIVWWSKNLNPPNNWIQTMKTAMQIKCLHGTGFLDLDCDLVGDPDAFAPCKQVIMFIVKTCFE